MQFDELLAHPTFWEQIWFDEKERDLPEPVKLHQPHLISGTVTLADIIEQTRVYHYIGSIWEGLSEVCQGFVGGPLGLSGVHQKSVRSPSGSVRVRQESVAGPYEINRGLSRGVRQDQL